jgi:hypothetical protein
VRESVEPDQTLHRSNGATTRDGQVVRIDCSTSIVYDVMEANGAAVLAQTFIVHLRSRPLPTATAYDIDCRGPLVVEIPNDASGVRARVEGASGVQAVLPVRARTTSVPLGFGKRLRAEPRTQFILVGWPRGVAADNRVELSFRVHDDRTIREKALYTVSVSCGASKYLQPVVPLVASMVRVPEFTTRPSAKAITFSPPRVAGANGTYAESTRALWCAS